MFVCVVCVHHMMLWLAMVVVMSVMLAALLVLVPR